MFAQQYVKPDYILLDSGCEVEYKMTLYKHTIDPRDGKSHGIIMEKSRLCNTVLGYRVLMKFCCGLGKLFSPPKEPNL